MNRPALGIRSRVAEHFVEEGGEDSGGFGVGLGALLSQRVRLVQYLHNPPLLGEGGKGELDAFHILSFDRCKRASLPLARYFRLDPLKDVADEVRQNGIRLQRADRSEPAANATTPVGYIRRPDRSPN